MSYCSIPKFLLLYTLTCNGFELLCSRGASGNCFAQNNAIDQSEFTFVFLFWSTNLSIGIYEVVPSARKSSENLWFECPAIQPEVKSNKSSAKIKNKNILFILTIIEFCQNIIYSFKLLYNFLSYKKQLNAICESSLNHDKMFPVGFGNFVPFSMSIYEEE